MSIEFRTEMTDEVDDLRKVEVKNKDKNEIVIRLGLEAAKDLLVSLGDLDVNDRFKYGLFDAVAKLTLKEQTKEFSKEVFQFDPAPISHSIEDPHQEVVFVPGCQQPKSLVEKWKELPESLAGKVMDKLSSFIKRRGQ